MGLKDRIGTRLFDTARGGLFPSPETFRGFLLYERLIPQELHPGRGEPAFRPVRHDPCAVRRAP
jgi:hypothetical protein